MPGEAFEFSFSLYGLLLGLSLAELFGGFARAIRARGQVRIGWLSPLLALLMVIDLISFWVTAWGERSALPLSFPTLLFGAAIAGIYYMAAALVFPEALEAGRDLDAHYFRQKVWVIVAIQASNWLVIAGLILLHGNIFVGWLSVARLALWTATGLFVIVARPKWLNLVGLLFYLQLYWITRLF